MRDPTYKRCKCRDADGRELGACCPKLRRADGSWNPRHGEWYFAMELPPGPNGKRRPRLRRGGFATQADALAGWEAAKGKLRKGADPASRLTVGQFLRDWLAGRARPESLDAPQLRAAHRRDGTSRRPHRPGRAPRR